MFVNSILIGVINTAEEDEERFNFIDNSAHQAVIYPSYIYSIFY